MNRKLVFKITTTKCLLDRLVTYCIFNCLELQIVYISQKIINVITFNCFF